MIRSIKTTKKRTPHKVIKQPEELILQSKSYYFDNYLVERLLYKYHETACTDVKLRDEIMEHASELIRQIIRANNLHAIYPGRDDSSFYDLFQISWAQIELSLYKYKAMPHCLGCYSPARPQDSILIECDEEDDMIIFDDLVALIQECPYCGTKLERNTIYYKGISKIFNMMSQVARTVSLAHIKRESRDKKNFNGYQLHLIRHTHTRNCVFSRFISELEEMFKYNDDYVCIIKSLCKLYEEDDKAHEGLITKLVDRSGKPRSKVTEFLKQIRLRNIEFTDTPEDEKPRKINEGNVTTREEDDL